MSFALISGGLSSLDPLLMRNLLDDALPRRHGTTALLLVLGIIGCLLGRALFLIFTTKLDFSVEQDTGQSLRISILDQLNRLSAQYHESIPPGDKMARLQNDVDQVSQGASQIVSSLFRALIFLVLNASIMLRIDARITLGLLPTIILFVWTKPRFTRSMRARADAAQMEAGRAGSLVTEYISALTQLQLLGAEGIVRRNAVSVWTDMQRARSDQRNLELLYSAIINAVFVLSIFVILLIGSEQVLRGVLTIGSLVAFYTYSTRIFEPVATLLDLFSRFQRVSASIRRIQSVLFASETVPDFGAIAKTRTTITQGISIQGVTFSYSSDRVALKNISFHIADRGRVGIVGPSGSGKSTLVRLLVRLADPQNGDITLDGYSIRDYSLAALRSTICYLPQSPVLFHGTVADNLRYGKPNATDKELETVIDTVRLADVIKRLPRGLNSDLGPAGHGLSGGEQQRLALARALLRSSPVLILDESTSALDVATERAVLESISNYGHRSILIIISHRLASLTWLDRLVVLKAGQVTASGGHEDLYASSSFYRSLYESGGVASTLH